MAIGRIPEPGTGIPESIIAAKGDVLTGTANDVPAVITVGANETRLVADSAAATGLKYVADTTNYAVAAKGDLLVGTAADTLAPLTVGTNGHTLVADSSTATGLAWAAASSGSYTLISSTTLTGTASTITFSSIPSTYTHLQIIFEGIGVDDFMRMTFNNVTTSTYYGVLLTARGNTVTAGEEVGVASMRCGTNNVLTSGVISIPNYKNSTIKKTINVMAADSVGTSSTQQRVQTFFGRNDATTAISQIDITCASAFGIGSIFSLYGVS
jgi:hypothetical protein